MAPKPFEEKQFGRVEKELKEVQKPEKEKEEKHEKAEKHEKEHKDQKDNKDAPDSKHKQEKEKQEKEHKHEKETHKIEKLEHEKVRIEGPADPFAAAAPDPTTHKFDEKFPEGKRHKDVKFEVKEHKDFKYEKLEWKEHKNEFKEFKNEKNEFDYVAGPGPIGPGDPVEQRLAALEAAVRQLLHFIPENLRPNLSQGALKQEPDAEKAAKPADPKTEPPKGKS
jgi:hypothetical protein